MGIEEALREIREGQSRALQGCDRLLQDVRHSLVFKENAEMKEKLEVGKARIEQLENIVDFTKRSGFCLQQGTNF